jgi:hypothetical protein
MPTAAIAGFEPFSTCKKKPKVNITILPQHELKMLPLWHINGILNKTCPVKLKKKKGI